MEKVGSRLVLLLLAGVMSACGGGGGDAGTTQVATLLPTGPVDSGNPGNPGSGSEPGGGGNHQSDPPGGQTPSDPPPSDPPPSDPPPSDPPPSDPPPSDPPPDPAVGCALLAQCLKVDSASVATYKGGKKAAASYTFDDGTDSSEAIASLFEARGLRASFYIVPSTVDNDQWAGWKDLSRRGHEIGNHSMTHSIDLGTPDLTEATLTAEILDAQNLIASRIGVKPMVFAFPWHSSTAASRAFALKTHLAIRTPTEELPFTLAFFDADHGPLPQALQDVNQQLSETVAAGGWYVAAGHGIDGSGWSPITSQFLNSHLDYARSFGSSLWTDTYLNVARYQICRKQARLNVQAPSAAQMKLTLNGSFDAACSEPLTVKIPLLVNGTPKLAAKDANGASVPVKKIAGAVTVDVLPGQSVTLTGQQ